MNGPWMAVAAVVVALLGSGGLTAYFGARLTNRTTRESNLMDQQQEDIGTLRDQVRRIQEREEVRDDYIMVLRQHIADGKAPPPPPFPAGLKAGGHS